MATMKVGTRLSLGFGLVLVLLLLVPVLLQARLLGVVELALPQRPDGALLEQVTAMAELLAINLGFSRRAAAWEVPSEEDVCDVC